MEKTSRVYHRKVSSFYCFRYWVLKAPETFVSYNPSNKNEVLGVFPKASARQARQAVEVAHQAFQQWQHEPAERRAARLFNVARLMRKRRNQLNAWCIL